MRLSAEWMGANRPNARRPLARINALVLTLTQRGSMTVPQERPVTILLAEETAPPGRSPLAAALRKAGWRVWPAGTVEEALRRARELPDLILLDARLPDGHGTEVCRQLKAVPATACIPVLLMYPAFTVNDSPAPELSGGADAYVVKSDQPVELVATVRAFLRLRHAEAEARADAEQWQVLFDALPEAVCLLDRDGLVRRCNLALTQLLGKTAKEVVGQPYRALFPAAPGLTPRDIAVGGRRYRMTAASVRSRSAAGTVCSLTDISSPDCSEDTPVPGTRGEQPTAQLHRLLEASAEGIVSIDRDGDLTFVNRAAAEMLGYGPGELLGKNFHTLVHDRLADAADTSQSPILQAAAGGRGSRVDNEVFWRRDGSAFSVEYLATPMPEGGAVVTFRDITEHKRLEERFRHSQKMEPVGRLASGVTHDFNNLLTIISGYSEILLSRLEPHDPNREMVAEIKKAEERAAELTRQLLAFSRRQIVEPKILDLNMVITEISRLLRRLIGEDIDIVAVPCPDLGGVRADMGQLEQVLLNLAVNARDAMPQGGRLLLKTANVELDEDYAAEHPEAIPGSCVQLTVSDTGCGMTDEVRSHLFEPFYTTKEPGKGTGLGLSTVYGIVKQSGGHIAVDSEPQRGTTFRIYLPRVAEPARGGAPAPGTGAPHLGKETILLTEDDACLCELICKVLTPLGYTVLRARNGTEAMQIAAEYPDPIHLVMCDVVMPQLTGRDLARRLTALRPDLRVLFISGYTNGIMHNHGVSDAGAVLAKPFSTEALSRKVREVLDRALMTR